MSTAIVEVESDQDLVTRFQALAHVLHNLRFFTKYWNEHGGYQARQNMKYWQDKADALLNSMGLTLHENISSVLILKY